MDHKFHSTTSTLLAKKHTDTINSNELQAVHSLIPCNNCKLIVNKQVTMTIITIIITVQMITKFQEGTHLPTWSPLQYIQTRCMYQRNPLICFPTYCT